MDLAGVVNGTLGVVCAAAVFAMSTGTMLQFFQNSKIKENYHNAGELEYQCFTMDFSDMAVIPESLQELQEQLIQADAPYVFTSRSSLPI